MQYFKVVLYKTGYTSIYQDNCGNNQFMQLINENGIRSRRGINKKPDLIKALARKEFNTKASEILTHNIAVLKRAIAGQILFDPEQIVQSMTKAYALVPEEYFFDRNRFIIPMGLDDDLVSRTDITRSKGQIYIRTIYS